ncbi:MAG: hypothetical protein K0Q62_376 [Phenylobacterium sp.]|jgi:apolipoprotein N-acyltransferase|nr:hypothetical protein [Phenylobacterium sp.]
MAADGKTGRAVSRELLVRLLALAIVAAALFAPPPYKTWLAASGCGLAAAVFLVQAIQGRPSRRTRWLNWLFALIFGATAIWLVFLR